MSGIRNVNEHIYKKQFRDLIDNDVMYEVFGAIEDIIGTEVWHDLMINIREKVKIPEQSIKSSLRSQFRTWNTRRR